MEEEGTEQRSREGGSCEGKDGKGWSEVRRVEEG